MGSSAQGRYQRAQEIVHEVLDLAAAERAQRIGVLCGDDAELRREVEWLIASVEISSPDDHLADVGALAQALLADARIEATAPRQYRLLERLGEGGMGQVWLAERDDGTTRQRVALKMLRGAGAPSDAELARFIAEGRILAALSHPNIAHLHDAGRGADGEPFLAMEYVDGGRVDRWCETHSLGLRARIELFLKVCTAVEYAHAQLVIHRDLKPANILVTATGEPKLLDFGIARLLYVNAGATHATTVLRAMTLAYASPEQIDGSALGTATDIYSLGVVLYELVAGVRPFDHIGSEHARSNAIVSGEITPPSRHLRTAPAATQGERRTLRGSTRRIPADIDAIVLKALRREPAQRYASVSEFADDLRRHLAAQPVLARRGRWTYRAQRFVWRNRWPLAVAVVLLALASGFTWRTLQAEHEARAQAETSERVTDFLTSIFATTDSDLNTSLRSDLSARQVLDASTTRIERELAGEPRIRARLLEAVGNAYRHMNANNRAAGLMREAADLNLSSSVDQPLAAARCLEALANLLANGEFRASEAEDAAQRSLALAQQLTPPSSQEVANAWMVLSLAQNRAGNYAAAEKSASTTLAMNLDLRTSPDNRLTAAYNNLCIILANRGDPRAADDYCGQAFPIYEARNEGVSIGMAMTMSRRAQVRAQLFDNAGSDTAMAQALSNSRAIQGERGPFTALFELRRAAILDDRGDYAQAAALLAHVLDIQAQLNGKDSGEYAVVQLEMARRHALLGEFAAAIELLRELRTTSAARYGADDPRVLHADTLLAQAWLDSGHADADARAALDAAMVGWASKDDSGVPAALNAAASLAQWFAMNGDTANAQPLLSRVEAPAARSDVWMRVRAALARATLARAKGDVDGALAAERSAYERLKNTVGDTHPQTARVGLLYAHNLRRAGRNDAATIEHVLRPVFERAFPADSAFRSDNAEF